MNDPKVIAVAALAATALMVTACTRSHATATTAPQAQSTDAARGKQIFAANCAACHGAAGDGGIGPSLRNERARKNLAQAVAWIKDPLPPMPKLYPAPLGERDVDDVAAYVESL